MIYPGPVDYSSTDTGLMSAVGPVTETANWPVWRYVGWGPVYAGRRQRRCVWLGLDTPRKTPAKFASGQCLDA